MISLQDLNKICKNTLISHLDIEFTEIGNSELHAKMPVNEKTIQPVKVLHGGASMALIETVGSALSMIHTDTSEYNVFGIAVNGNHVKSCTKGSVIAKGSFMHKGNTTHVVGVEIRNEEGELISIGRITNMLVKKG